MRFVDLIRVIHVSPCILKDNDAGPIGGRMQVVSWDLVADEV